MEQRSQDYYRLIYHLFTCCNGEQPKILMANSHLIDDGLVEAFKQVSSMMARKGNQNLANYLIHLANDLPNAPFFIRSLTTTIDARNNPSQRGKSVQIPPLLDEICKKIIESQSNPQVVYSLLQANKNKLDDNFVQQIHNWAFSTLPNAKPEVAEMVATVISDFSALMWQFPLGNRDINLEIAITGYEVAATIFTREAFPQKWADIQTNLAPVYRHRIRGNRANNQEKAIVACNNAQITALPAVMRYNNNN